MDVQLIVSADRDLSSEQNRKSFSFGFGALLRRPELFSESGNDTRQVPN
jgi:hypothetical protein